MLMTVSLIFGTQADTPPEVAHLSLLDLVTLQAFLLFLELLHLLLQMVISVATEARRCACKVQPCIIERVLFAVHKHAMLCLISPSLA